MEAVKGEAWARFVDRYGDWGRDLALWVARRRGGMTLRELGANAGGMDYSAVSETIRTFDRIHRQKTEVRRARDRVCQYLNLETRPYYATRWSIRPCVSRVLLSQAPRHSGSMLSATFGPDKARDHDQETEEGNT